MPNGETSAIEALIQPERLWSAAEVTARPCPVPAEPGLYGWWFLEKLHGQLPTGQLLYVGIAPRRSTGRPSSQNIRTRLHTHLRGNAEGSALRLSIGCLLGLQLRRVGNGRRMTFGQQGEADLTAWIAEHARISWMTHPQPWLPETELIATRELPLNLDQNDKGPFHSYLTQLRAEARRQARELPISQ